TSPCPPEATFMFGRRRPYRRLMFLNHSVGSTHTLNPVPPESPDLPRNSSHRLPRHLRKLLRLPHHRQFRSLEPFPGPDGPTRRLTQLRLEPRPLLLQHVRAELGQHVLHLRRDRAEPIHFAKRTTGCVLLEIRLPQIEFP